MFSLAFLNELREYEFQTYLGHFPAGCNILEIGGGTGIQAKLLSERGYHVESVDVETSNYAAALQYPIKLYDGRHLPFPENSFDIVFSSNVLEHIRDIEEFQSEIRRVLKPSGYCVHAMPSGSWTFWTILTHYLTIIEQISNQIRTMAQCSLASDSLTTSGRAPPSGTQLSAFQRFGLRCAAATECTRVFGNTLRNHRDRLLPSRHGEFGNVLTELVSFSRFVWMRHFRKCSYEIIEANPMGLFYTGNMFFGSKWPLASRSRWAPLLGSACILYKVRPKA
jgi:ubiquinone/menaquinone biosynthesis C-methylase UbiE